MSFELSDDDLTVQRAIVALQGDLVRALIRIRDYEFRADRRKRGMVDRSVVDDLQRIAHFAIEENAKKVSNVRAW